MAYLNYIHWLKKREAVERIPQSGPTTTATKKRKMAKQTTEIFKVFNLSGFLACWLCSVPHVMDLEWLAVGHVQRYISSKYILHMYLYIMYTMYILRIRPAWLGSNRLGALGQRILQLEIRLEHDIWPRRTSSLGLPHVQHMSVESHRVVKVESCNDISNLRTMTKWVKCILKNTLGLGRIEKEIRKSAQREGDRGWEWKGHA